jgi:catechol 2,3-dioxygenase-like lactoylglutathione lyase family enzyme
MINGAHFLLYSKDPEADRAFLRDVLGFRSVDAGRGWLIFALPPAEIAVHPSDEGSSRNMDEGVASSAFYLLCDDLKSTMRSLEGKKASFAQVQDAQWGIVTTFALPSGAKIGLYQPKHPTAVRVR